MKKGKVKNSSKLNIKKISFGTALATGAIVTGVVLGEELKKHEQLEEKGKEDGIKGGGFKAALDTNNQQAQSAIEDKLTSAWSGIKTIADSGIAGKTWSDIHGTEVEPWITQLNGGTAIPHCTITKVEFFKHGQQVQADNDDKNVDAKISFKDDSQTNASLTFDKTISDLTFSKSPNQKTLDDANITISETSSKPITNTFFTQTAAVDKTNYDISGLPSGANFAVTVATPTPTQTAGPSSFDVTATAKVTLGTATKDITTTLNFSKFDKQSDVTAVENLMNGFTFTGNERQFDLNMTRALSTALASAASLVELEYTKDGTTWTKWPTTSLKVSSTAGDSSSTFKVRLVRSSRATNSIFKFANNDSDTSGSYTPTGTLNAAIDVKALKDLMTAANFTLGGTSVAPTITFVGAIPQGLKLEIKNGTGNFVTVSQNKAISTGIYSTQNLFDNTTATGALNSGLDYRISLTNATNVLWDSSTPNTATITSPLTGSVTPTPGTGFKKIIPVATISPSATGNTESFTITEGTVPNNTKILYTVYDSAGIADQTAKDKTAAEIVTWSSGKNLWDTASKAFKYTIKAKLAVIDANNFALAAQATETNLNISALDKLITTDASLTTGTVTMIDGLSKDVKSLITNPGTPVDGIVYKYWVDSNAPVAWSAFTLSDFWDQTKPTNGDWKYTSLKVKVEAAPGYVLPSTATNGFERVLWSTTQTTGPTITKYVDSQALITDINGSSGIKVTGTDDKHLVWTPANITSLTSTATKLNINIKYAFTETTTAPTVWDNISNLASKTTYPTANTSATNRHIQVKLEANPGFAVDSTTSTFEVTSTGLQIIAQQINTANIDLATQITKRGDSKSLVFTPSGAAAATNGHYKISYSTSNTGTFESYATFASKYLTNINIYDSANGQWKIPGVWAKIEPESTSYTLSDEKVTHLWDQTGVDKLVEISKAPTATFSGNTNNIKFTDPTAIPNVEFTYEVFATGLTTPAFSGTKTDAETFISQNNLWNQATGDWKYSEIKIKFSPQAGKTDVKLSTATAGLSSTVWSSATNPATTNKYITTSAIAANDVTFTWTDSKTATINETYPAPADATKRGFTYEYSVDGSNWMEKAAFGTFISTNNLWDQTKSTNGDWRYSNIKVRLKVGSGFILDSPASNATTGAQVKTLLDFSQSVGTVNIKKYVDTKGLIDEIKKLNITIGANGTDDANLVWNGVQGIKDLATKLNLNVEIALTDSTTVQTSPQGVTGITWIALDDMATTGKKWSKEKVDKSAKRVWAKITPKTSFTVSPSATIGTVDLLDTVYYNTTSTSNANLLRYNHVILSTDLDDLTASAMTSQNFTISEPNHNEFSYVYYFNTNKTVLYHSLSELNQAIVGLDSNGKEGMWNSTTNGWRINTITAKLIAKPDYVLSGTDEKEIWSNQNPEKFNGTQVGITKYIDTNTAGTTNDVFATLKNAVKPESSSLNDQVLWTSAETTIANIKARGIKIEFAYSDTDAWKNVKTDPNLKWTTDIKTIDKIDENHAKRFLYARISPQNPNTILTQNNAIGNYLDLSNDSSIKTIKTDIDTTTFTIDNDLLKGDTHNLTGSTKLNLQATGILSTYKNKAVKIVYSLNDWGATPAATVAANIGFSGSIPNEMSETQLKNILNGTVSKGLYDFKTGLTTTIKAKIVFDTTTYQNASTLFNIKDQKLTTLTQTYSASYKKWVNTSDGRANVSTSTNANAIKAISTSLHDAVTWNSISPTSIGYQNVVSKFQYYYGPATTASAIQHWSDNLPTIVAYDHSSRNLWVKFVTSDSTITYSDDTPINITTSSGIKTIKSRIDTEANFATWDATKIKFAGTTDSVTIASSLAGTLPVGAKIEYRVSVYNSAQPATPWHTSNWMEETAFKALIKSPARIKIRTIEAHLAIGNTNSALYSLTNDKHAFCDITGLYSYVDVSTEHSYVDPISIMTNTPAKIQVWGILGSGSQSGIQVIIPSQLQATELAKKGLVLQMSINGGKFEDFIAATTDQAQDTTHAYQQATKGLYKTFNVADMGTVTHSSLKFRIIANVQDDLVTPPKPALDKDDWSAISNDIQVKTSEMVSNNAPLETSVDLQTLPKLVKTQDKWISDGITISGTTRVLAINGLDASAIENLLSTENGGVQGYGAQIEIGFRVNDGKLPSNYYLKRTDFISWLAGTLTGPVEVFDTTAATGAATGNQVKSTITLSALAKPDWNKIDMGTFTARWFSNVVTHRVSNSAVFTIPTSTTGATTGATPTYNVKKWTDLTSYLNSLKKMVISGNTLKATSTSLATVQSSLDTAFGAGKFKIQSTKTLNAAKTNGDWTNAHDYSTAANADPLPELNFLYELGLRIIPTGTDFVASTEANNGSTDLDVIWDKNSSTTVQKYVHVDVQDIVDHYKLSGDSRNLVAAFDNAKFLKFNQNGIVDANGTYTGIEIWARVAKPGLTGANNKKLDTLMPIADLIRELAAAPASIFDGTWGRSEFKIAYKPATDYTTDSANLTETAPKADNLTLNRWIDLSAEITSANGIKIKTKNATQGWWNDAATDYSNKSIWNNNWAGYVDNKDFDLTAYTQNTNHKTKIQYYIGTAATAATIPASANWSNTIPTILDETQSNRHLYYRFVVDGDYSPVGTASNKEIAVLSDSAAHDITTGSNVQKVPTRIDVTGVDLSKITFTGNTRAIVENITANGINVPAHTHVEYSITDFINPKSTNATQAAIATTALGNIGVTSSGANASIFNAYKASMTISELKSFIKLLQPTEREIIRSSVKARLVPEQDYSITQTDEGNVRKSITVDGLYTLKDITDLTSYLKLATTTGGTDGINLYGEKGTTNGILVQIPDDLVSKLASRGLKLQYSTTAQEINQSPWTALSSTPTWINPDIKDYSATGSSGVSGAPAVKNGFKITLKAESSTHNEYSYLGFRIVPIVDDLNNPTTIATTGQAIADISAYYNDTKTKLYVSTGTFPHKSYVEQAASYDIDTSQLPEVINVTGIDLAQILATGTTKSVVITGDTTAHAEIDSKNPHAASTLKDNLEFLYSIDKKDGSFIDGDKGNADAVWLTKADMIAYLAGNLVVQGTDVVYKNNTQEKVEAFTPAMITLRGFKPGDTYAPKYLDINTIDKNKQNSFFVKWVSMDKDYNANTKFIPSVLDAKPLTYTPDDFRKWFNGEHFNTQISKLIIKGTTENASSWTVDYTNAPDITDAALLAYDLKMQYSPDGTTWTDKPFDWSTLSWTVRDARVVYMRVVPNTTTFQEVAGAANSKAIQDKNVYIDYAQSGIGNTANTTSATNGNRAFKTYLKNVETELSTIAITGNSFELLSTALDETAVDNNTEEQSKLEIQYLFDGAWYTKSALLAEMKTRRDSITDATKAAAFKLPTDFTHSEVKARWHVTDTNNYVLNNEQTGNVSPDHKITKTNFKTFVNVWDIQEWGSATTTKQNWLPALGTQTSLISLAISSGATLTLNSKIIDQTALSQTFLTAHNLKFQYSVKATPSTDLISTDWIDGKTYPNIIDGQAWQMNQNAPLWIRLVPISTSDYVFSNYESNGNTSKITPISIDTSSIKYTITTSSTELADLKLTGDTQNNLTTSDTRFSTVHDETGQNDWGIKGVTEYITDASNNVVAKPTQTEVDEWYNGKGGVGSKGLRINYKVTATRTKGTYTKGQEYTFNTLSDLKAALNTHNLNFDTKTLQIRWDFSNTTFVASDSNWVNPTDVNSIINVVYTNDVYNLNSSSFVVTGNDLKTQAPTPNATQIDSITNNHANPTLTATELANLGLKIQYNWVADASNNPDANSWKDTPADGQTPQTTINSNKDYWIRYWPNDLTKYKLAVDNGDANQVTKLNVDAIKLSIAFANDKPNVIKELQTAALKGFTFDFQFDKALPLPHPHDKSINYETYGHIQYSIDGQKWSDDIAGALSGTNYYNNGVYQFDKDRGDKLHVRYVFEHTKGNVTPTDSQKYVYTDKDGNEFTLSELTWQIDINNLIQPIFTSATLGQLSNQPTITVQGLTNPSGGAEFANTAWKDLANFGLFKPKFKAGNTSQVADFEYMWYDGTITDANNKYIFGLESNPFNTADKRQSTNLNGLLPRHTHLEYQWAAGSGGTYTNWTEVPPTGITKNSNFAGFNVRLVADTGYTLDGNVGTTNGFAVSRTYPDNSTNSTIPTIPSQVWDHSYNVVVELLTSDIHLKSANQIDQAEYVGWNDNVNPSGRFKTDDALGDYTPSNDSQALKNILVKLYSGTGAAEKLIDFVADGKGYVLEWNVTNSNNDIEWTDSRGDVKKGWHTAIFGDPDQAPEDTDNRPWYGAYPTSLKNGDVVQVRLRARNGFIISKDANSTDYEKGKLNAATGSYELAGTKTSRWSHTISFAPVSGLTTRIDIPKDFSLFDTAHLIDFNGVQITPNATMPVIRFSGDEGKGSLAITPSGVHYHYEVAVLKPLSNGSSSLTPLQKPLKGYCLDDAATQLNNNGVSTTIVWTAGVGWTQNYKKILENNQAWVLPSQVNNLEVGDGIVVRLVAEPGYGFEWEDLTTTWTDSLFPKDHTYDLFGTSADNSTISAHAFDQLADQKATQLNALVPIPVRGLEVVPRYATSALSLVYATDPSKKLNNGQSEISLNFYPGMIDAQGNREGLNDKYNWAYVIRSANGTSNQITYSGAIKGLKNGDVVEVFAIPKDSGYTLSHSYNNTHQLLTVQSLSDPLDATNVDKPTLEIQGYDGEGTIIGISSTNSKPSWQIFDKTQDPANYAKYPLGRPVNSNNDDLIWEYQVVKTNPFDWSPEREAREKWTTTIPTNLQHGDYVRMRVGAINKDEVALANGTDWVYSVNTQNPIKADDGSITGGGPNAKSWFKVENLWVKPDQLDYQADLTGFIRKTNISIQPVNSIAETGYVKLQVKVTYKDTAKQATSWLEYNKTDANKVLRELSNGDVVQWRVVTENGKGFRFNPNETFGQKSWFKYDEDFGFNDYVNGPSATPVKNTMKVDTYENPAWTFAVSGLKIYIDTDNVMYDPDLSGKGFNVSQIIVDANGNTASATNLIVEGAGMLKTIGIMNPATIVDATGQTTAKDSSNNDIILKDIVGVKYVVKLVDPISGISQPPKPIYEPPKNLNNDDEITVELYSKNNDFQISNSKSMTIVVKDLTTSASDPITDPFLTFIGESGKGSVAINPQPPLRTKWVYAVTPEPLPGKKLPEIYELKNANDHTQHLIDPDPSWIAAHPDTYYWTSNPPVTLQNGDYVIAMLTSTKSGSLIANNVTPGREWQIPMNTSWIRVSGLAQKIDLSRYQFKIIDEENPWNSNQDNEYDPVSQKYQISNYAFKLQGHQEGETSMVINSVLEPASQDPADLSKLLVDQYNRPLPSSIASVVQWVFAVNGNPEANGDYNWSTTLPKTLSNGQYVHVKLVAKSGLTNVQVYGYKPQVFKVEGLDASASVTNKVATLVSVVVGGFVALGAAVGTLMFIRKRKKKLHFND